MKDCRRRTPFVLVLLAVLALTVGPTGAADDDRPRDPDFLRSKLVLVFLFERDMPELARRGQGIQTLETEIRRAIEETPDSSGYLGLLQELQLEWAKLKLSRGNEDEALVHFEEVLAGGKSATGYQEAALASARIYHDQAKELEEAEDDSRALERYSRAEELYRQGGDVESAQKVGRLSANLEAREGLKAFAAKKYGEAYDNLSKLKDRNPPGFPGSDGDQKLTWLNQNTGVLTIGTLTVPAKVPGQSVSGLRIALKRVRKGDELPPRPFVDRLRWEIGDYKLELIGRDGRAILSVPVSLGVSGGSAVIPSKLPDGMAFIPAGGSVTKSFFIDKTEVTVGAFREEFPRHRFEHSQPNLPAHGVPIALARQYAAKVGKQLPTYAQWQRAAFGDEGKKYPWGNTDAQSLNRLCNIGTGRPMPVGSFENGESPFGVLDMAGNVWEWLRDGYAIGGGYRKARLGTESVPTGWDHVVDYLRDKKPDDSEYAKFRDPGMRERYDKYRIKSLEMLEEVGFRCVLEF